jgi:hypothetical protein
VVTPPPPATSTPSTKTTTGTNPVGCKRPKSVKILSFSKAKYPNIRAHYLRAVAKGWPRIMVVNRKGADARRDRLLEDIPTKAGFDRDEYPAAVGRGRSSGLSKALTRGITPIGWMADVEYVPSGENRSHGSSLGAKLRRLCNGARFRYAFQLVSAAMDLAEYPINAAPLARKHRVNERSLRSQLRAHPELTPGHVANEHYVTFGCPTEPLPC